MVPLINDDGQSTKITQAVRSVYEEAELDPGALESNVVPLFELIGAYPIRVMEIKDLTYENAAKYLAAETGQSISFPGRGDKLAGFLYSYEYRGCIMVKAEDPIGRRRFSAAHELGHYVMHFLPLLDGRDVSSDSLVLEEGLAYADEDKATNELPSGQPTLTHGEVPESPTPISDVQRMEREANQFAAELLMPATFCEALVERYGGRFGGSRSALARRLATEFLVSQAAMKWRLKDLGLPNVTQVRLL